MGAPEIRDKFQDRSIRDDFEQFVTEWLEANPHHAGEDYTGAATASRDDLPYRLMRAAVRETLDYERENDSPNGFDPEWSLDDCPLWYVQTAVRETLLLAFEDHVDS